MNEQLETLFDQFENMDSWDFSRETFLEAILDELGEQGLMHTPKEVILRMMEIACHHSVEYASDLDFLCS